MRILVDIGHPGHVHFFKHVIWQLQARGHEVRLTAREKDVTCALLDHYGFAYRVLSASRPGRRRLLREFVQREWALLHFIRAFDPHVVAAIGGAFIAPVCKLLGKPSVVFTDSEHVALDRYLTYPLATVICTPEPFKRQLARQVRYAGYQELAYLHPNYFRPDPSVLGELGLSPGEPYAVLRFVAWQASHDVGQHGFSSVLKRCAVETLRRYGRAFITSEGALPKELSPYRLAVPPHRIHDVLAHAQLYLGEGATMATEAGLLGTPSVYVSSLVGTMGNFAELMDRYQLVHACRDPAEGLRRAEQLLRQKDIKGEYAARRQRMLADKLDVTAFARDTIERLAGGKR